MKQRPSNTVAWSPADAKVNEPADHAPSGQGSGTGTSATSLNQAASSDNKRATLERSRQGSSGGSSVGGGGPQEDGDDEVTATCAGLFDCTLKSILSSTDLTSAGAKEEEEEASEPLVLSAATVATGKEGALVSPQPLLPPTAQLLLSNERRAEEASPPMPVPPAAAATSTSSSSMTDPHNDRSSSVPRAMALEDEAAVAFGMDTDEEEEDVGVVVERPPEEGTGEGEEEEEEEESGSSPRVIRPEESEDGGTATAVAAPRGVRAGDGEEEDDEWMDLTAADASGGGEMAIPSGAVTTVGPPPAALGSLPEGTCEECERSLAVWACDACQMPALCDMCFGLLHRKGKRALHAKRPRPGGKENGSNGANGHAGCSKQAPASPKATKSGSSSSGSSFLSSFFNTSSSSSPPRDGSSSSSKTAALHPSRLPPLGSSQPMRERAKYIPLRLAYDQRKSLRLVEAALAACDYTARVDRVFKSAAQREHAQLRQITAVMQAMVMSENYKSGQALVEDGEYEAAAPLVAKWLEVARRHKIMNPEKMRGEYGKLAYLLQDAVSPRIQAHLRCNIAAGGIRTVSKLLEAAGALKMLDDPQIHTATQEILPDAGKSRSQIQQEIKRKERAVEFFARHYASPHLSADDVRLCLYSICDNNSFLNSNRVPIDKTIALLAEHFSPDKVEPGYSLAIVQGQDGARLTHSHERQYNFALQSLTLWREITDDMFRLWCLAEEDLLSSDPNAAYELRDTGQGLHRVQPCPRTFHAMQDILHKTQRRVGSWVGSSVIHLGDHNVPNALMFIDKYTQVPRILAPIVQCLEQAERVFNEDEGVRNLIKRSFGGLEKLKKDILHDFFRNAFDGSGGINYFDAGSCVDGRLTSAWNWCNKLPSKPFYPIFKLTGFLSFEGDLDR